LFLGQEYFLTHISTGYAFDALTGEEEKMHDNQQVAISCFRNLGNYCMELVSTSSLHNRVIIYEGSLEESHRSVRDQARKCNVYISHLIAEYIVSNIQIDKFANGFVCYSKEAAAFPPYRDYIGLLTQIKIFDTSSHRVFQDLSNCNYRQFIGFCKSAFLHECLV
jgi:hypothetical protein